jgi:hypothetical protein
MTARDHVHRFLKEVVRPYLRAEGFAATGQTWRLHTPDRDFAIVSVQSSKWSTPEMYECVMNLAVVPAPWWDWQQSRLARATPALPGEASGLYRGRLHAGGAAANEL